MQSGDGIWPGSISIYPQRTACSFIQHLEKYWDKGNLKSMCLNPCLQLSRDLASFYARGTCFELVRLPGVWHCKISGCWKADKGWKKWQGNMQNCGARHCGSANLESWTRWSLGIPSKSDDSTIFCIKAGANASSGQMQIWCEFCFAPHVSTFPHFALCCFWYSEYPQIAIGQAVLHPAVFCLNNSSLLKGGNARILLANQRLLFYSKQWYEISSVSMERRCLEKDWLVTH